MLEVKEKGFAEVLKIGKGDDYFGYPQIIGAKLHIAKIHKRAGPWFSVTGVLLSPEIIPLNGDYFEKGGHIWLHKAKLKPISHI